MTGRRPDALLFGIAPVVYRYPGHRGEVSRL
jgi:hypothetical protein